MKVLAKNKRAGFDYEITDKRQAGLILQGHEVKSIKTGKANITDAVVYIRDGEARIINMDVPLYGKTHPNTVSGYEPKGTRKLLLNKKEIAKIWEKTNKSGLKLIPLALLYGVNHKIKVEIGLGKRRKKVEKRSVIRDRETKRMLDRESKKY